METPLQSCLIMRWGQQSPGTNQLPSSMGKVCHPLLPYPMNLQTHINIPYFLGLWLHLQLSEIPLSILYSSSFLTQLCPLS